MAQTKDENKRIAIRNAVIADVVESGLSNAPVSRIAKRAGVSAGTIYIYYPNKEDMVQSIFLEIKSILHEKMMGARASGTNSAERIRLMWFAMFQFIIENPDMFAFHEAIDSDRLLDSKQKSEISKMAAEIRAALQAAIDDGTLKNMPLDCLLSLLLAPVAALARRMISSGKTNHEDADCVFRAIWTGIIRAD